MIQFQYLIGYIQTKNEYKCVTSINTTFQYLIGYIQTPICTSLSALGVSCFNTSQATYKRGCPNSSYLQSLRRFNTSQATYKHQILYCLIDLLYSFNTSQATYKHNTISKFKRYVPKVSIPHRLHTNQVRVFNRALTEDESFNTSQATYKPRQSYYRKCY